MFGWPTLRGPSRGQFCACLLQVTPWYSLTPFDARAAARRRRLERSSASITSAVAALDPDADQAGSLDSDSEEEGVLGSGLDPTDTPDRDADAESESVPLAASAAAGGIQSTVPQPTMQIMYEVEFVRVQVRGGCVEKRSRLQRPNRDISCFRFPCPGLSLSWMQVQYRVSSPVYVRFAMKVPLEILTPTQRA